MPEYIYKDSNHEVSVHHPMQYDEVVVCSVCGEEMWRVPQLVSVNWNGLPPSKETELSPEMKHMIDNGEQRRDEYRMMKETK